MAVELQEIAPEALETIGPLISRVFRQVLDLEVEDVLADELDAAAAAYRPGADLFLAAFADGRPVGALVSTRRGTDGDSVALVSWLAVDPGHAHRGVGRQLLDRTILACRAQQADAVEARTFVSSPAGPRLLWSLGFRAADIVPVDLGGRSREMLLFRLPLAPSAPPS